MIGKRIYKQAGILLITALMCTVCTPQVKAAEGKKDPANKRNSNNDNTWENTGIGALDIAVAAESQIGYEEQNQHSKYTEWYYEDEMEASWNAIFVSWCASRAGISDNLIRKNANSGCNRKTIDKNPFGCPAYYYNDTIACVGDIVFVDTNQDAFSEKVGIITRVDQNYLYVAEGDLEGRVEEIQYNKTDGTQSQDTEGNSYIMFLGRPDYQTTMNSSYQWESSGTTGNYMITAAGLNVRTGPGENNDAIGSYLLNSVVEVCQVENSWGKIDYSGTDGWVCLDYCRKLSEKTEIAEENESAESQTALAENTETLESIESTEEETGTEAADSIETSEDREAAESTEAAESSEKIQAEYPHYIVLAGTINVREGGGTQYPVVSAFNQGTEIEITEENNGWGRVIYSGGQGWVCLDYCEKIDTSPQDTEVKETEDVTKSDTEITDTEIADTEAADTEIADAEIADTEAEENTEAADTEITDTEAAGKTEKSTDSPKENHENPDGDDFVITAGELRIRSDYNADSAVLGTYSENDVVTVYTVKNGWGRVKMNDQTGWINMNYCTLLTIAQGNIEKETGNYIVLAPSLNVRSSSSLTSSSLGQLSAGDEVTVLKWKGSWGEISYNGKDGWINGDYCSQK